MVVVGVDDTDSRSGMCTTFVASDVASQLERRGACVNRLVLVRLNPAVEHKTRGNAALAIHTDADPDVALSVATDAVAEHADAPAANTNPAVVVGDHAPATPPTAVAEWARAAVRRHLDRHRALELVEAHGYRHVGWGNQRGTVGALAAIGAWAAGRTGGGPTGAPCDWTYECIAYRHRDRWGTARSVDQDAIFTAAAAAYPDAWDTVDTATGTAVCVPNTPCPVLLGVRGDELAAIDAIMDRIEESETEPVARRRIFVTNQGTDAHLRSAPLAAGASVAEATSSETAEAPTNGAAYRIDGTVTTTPETRRGGHVHVTVRDGDTSLQCVAFEPTGRFRDHVRSLQVGDRITVCGEITGDTLKLEKFALRSPAAAGTTTPHCPECDRTMSSAGAGQGYRCRPCGTTTAGRVQRPQQRSIDPGWYEVPPSARRHVARPLIRGGTDAPAHPER